jgi:hypothetical protein
MQRGRGGSFAVAGGVIVASVSALLAASACNAIDGADSIPVLEAGAHVDARPDVTQVKPPRDAGVDATSHDASDAASHDGGREASSREASTREGGRDVEEARDAGRDGGSPHDGAIDAERDAHEASPPCPAGESADAGLPSVSCSWAFTDAAGCSPHPIDAAALVAIASPIHRNVCTSAEIATLTSGTPVADAACNSCIVTNLPLPAKAQAYGAVIRYTEGASSYVETTNAAGCIAALDRCNSPCASLLLASALCAVEECRGGCIGEDAGSLVACINMAQSSCPCLNYQELANICLQNLELSESPALACFTNPPPDASMTTKFDIEAVEIARVLCGDGGS